MRSATCPDVGMLKPAHELSPRNLGSRVQNCGDGTIEDLKRKISRSPYNDLVLTRQNGRQWKHATYGDTLT